MRPTRSPGAHYTLEALKDFVRYCAKRHIMVIPELDIPGHSEYFDETFGFDMQDPRGVEILVDLIDEWCEVFDAPYFHIGSDEVKIRNKERLT